MVVLLLVTFSIALSPCSATDPINPIKNLTYITEQYPPYNFQEEGQLQGISVDLLEEMWKRMGIPLNKSAIELLPWTEGYQRALNENNTVLFTTFRLPEREQLFKWVGPAASGRDVLLAKKDKNVTIADPQDLKKYRIGAIKDDVAVQRLLKSGLSKDDLILESTSAPIMEMLENGSLDAWAYNDLAGIVLIQEAGENASDYAIAYVLAQGDGYYAFNKGTPDSVVRSFQEALDYIQNDQDANGVFMLLQIQADLQGSLNDLDSDMANAAQNLSLTGLKGDAARRVLRELIGTNSNLNNAITIGKDGKIIIAEGRGSESAEGADISSQEHIARLLQAKTPALSKQLLLVEGYNGTSLAYPVFSAQGEFLGGVSAIIEPDKLVNAIVAPQLNFDVTSRANITDYSFWLMHLDGLIAYDRDESQIGKYLFEDPLYAPYPSLLALGEKMITDRSGHGSYSFQVTEGQKKVVTKDTYWTTVGLHGMEWRLVVTKILQ
jgi:polar amino acid transport system substrate-binding protein